MYIQKLQTALPVLPELLGECLGGGEFALAPEVFHRLNRGAAAVEIAVKVKDVGLEAAAAAGERGVGADVEHAGQAPAVQLEPRGVYAVRAVALDALRAQVGRWEAKLVPQLPAMHYDAFNSQNRCTSGSGRFSH